MFRRNSQGNFGTANPSPGMMPGAAPQTVQRPGLSQFGTRFTMRQRIFTFGDDFFITNENNQRVIRVDGKIFRMRDTLNFEDMQGHILYVIKARMADIRETMDILHANGRKAAVVHNAWFSPFRDKWKIDIPGGQDMSAVGGILQHEYSIKRGGQVIAEVSKKWLRVADNYQVQLDEPYDAPLILAITVVIDMMSHNQAGGTSKGSRVDIL